LPKETRNIGLSYGVHILQTIISFCHNLQSFDRQTDGRTDIDSKTVRMHSESHDKNETGLVTYCEEMMTALLITQNSGHHIAAQEDSDPVTPEKGIWSEKCGQQA